MVRITPDKLPDDVFAFSELKEDLVYRRIPRDKRQYYIEAGLTAGRQMAHACQGKDLPAVLHEDGVVIRRLSEPSPTGLHAQICYDGNSKQVDLYMDTAHRLSRAMEKTPFPIAPDVLEQLFLAHEFYHWVEYASGSPTEEQCEPLRTKWLGVIPRTIRVRRVDEIAAFAFAKEFCSLPIHPKAIDYILMCQEQAESYEKVCALFVRMEQEWRAACL